MPHLWGPLWLLLFQHSSAVLDEHIQRPDTLYKSISFSKCEISCLLRSFINSNVKEKTNFCSLNVTCCPDGIQKQLNIGWKQFFVNYQGGFNYWQQKISTFISQARDLQSTADVWAQLSASQQASLKQLYTQAQDINARLASSWNQCLLEMATFMSGFYCMICTPANDIFFIYSDTEATAQMTSSSCTSLANSCNCMWHNLFAFEFASQCFLSVLQVPNTNCTNSTFPCANDVQSCTPFVCSIFNDLDNPIPFNNIASTFNLDGIFRMQEDQPTLLREIIKNLRSKYPFYRENRAKRDRARLSAVFVSSANIIAYPTILAGSTGNYIKQLQGVTVAPANITQTSSASSISPFFLFFVFLSTIWLFNLFECNL